MLEWGNLNFEPLANAVLAAITAIITWTAIKLGRTSKPPKAVKVETIAVTNEPMRKLALAVEANNAIQQETQKIDQRRLNAIEDLTEELKELRNEMARSRR